MSEQIPLTREALYTWASADDASITCRLAKSALAYMHTLDAVIVERNEAYRQRDGYELQIIDARDILGAAPDELLSDAARRHARTEELVTEARKYLEPLLSKPDGDIEDLALAVSRAAGEVGEALECPHGVTMVDHAARVMAELRRLREVRDGQARAAQQDAEAARAAMRRMEIDHKAALAVARMDAAEAEPPQVFRTIPRVVVEQPSQFKGRCVRIEIVTSDPAVLALTAGQLSRLGLVVCDG